MFFFYKTGVVYFTCKLKVGVFYTWCKEVLTAMFSLAPRDKCCFILTESTQAVYDPQTHDFPTLHPVIYTMKVI